MQTRAYNLNDLPPNVLADVTSYFTDGCNVLNMWKCGDARLTRNMQHGGVVNLVLRDLFITPHQVCIPAMVTELYHLRKLRIRSLHMAPESNSLQRLGQFLPPTLTHLSLALRGINTILSTILLSEWIPNLLYLELANPQNHNDNVDSYLSLLSDNLLQLLPPYLHTLKVSYINIGAHTNLHAENTLVVPPTSTYLKNLRLDLTDVGYWSPNGKRHPATLVFPPNLIKLDLYQPPNIRSKQKQLPEMIFADLPLLPPTLTELSIFLTRRVVLGDHWGLLPNLLTLIFRSDSWDYDLRYDLWRNIPRSLTKLDISYYSNSTITSQYTIEQFRTLLPPQLKHLSTNVRLPVHFTDEDKSIPDHTPLWPATLRHLELPMPVDGGSIHAYRLPPSLKTLRIIGTPYVIGFLRMSENVTNPVACPMQPWQFNSLCHLTRLTLGVFALHELPNIIPALLPPLKRLAFGIRDLTFEADLSALTDYSRGKLGAEEAVAVVLRRLPSALERLTLQVGPNSIPGVCYRHWFSILPPTLFKLEINLNLEVEIENGDLASIMLCLPRQLTKLKLRIENYSTNDITSSLEKMDAIQFSLLPPHLESFSLLGHYFSLRSLDCIMPRMRKLSISRTTSLAYDPKLFPCLERVRIQHMTDFVGATYATMLYEAE